MIKLKLEARQAQAVLALTSQHGSYLRVIKMMKMLRHAWLLLACCLSAAAGAEEGRKVIAFAQDTLANDFRRAQVEETRAEAARYPELQFVHSDANGQTALLIRQIEQFTEQRVDLLVVGTNDEKAVVPAVSQAQRSGIPVIILDRGIEGGQYTTFINSDNLRIGMLGAREIARRLKGRGQVLLFEGLPTADVTRLRSKGFLGEIGRHKDIRVIRRFGNYLRKDAVIEMEKLLAAGIRVDAIFSESDSMLSGVRTVLSKNGIDPKSIIMIGCDYTSEAREAIRQGTQTGSVLFPLGGRQAVTIARQIFRGESVPKHVVIPVELVTRDNVEKVPAIF